MSNNIILTEEQRDLQMMVRDFVRKEIIPNCAEWDRKSEFPMDVFKKYVEMGLTTLTLPEELGGAGMGTKEAVIVAEEIGYGDAGFAVSAGACSLGTIPIMLGGTDKQKAEAADRLANGCLAAYCLTEPEAGSNAGALKTKAVKDGNDYIISGSKCFITNAGIADFYTVFATVDKEKGTKGITCFMIEKDRAGVSCGKEEDKMGIRASNTGSVMFDDVRVPADHMIGPEGAGYKLALGTLARTRPSGNAAAVGIMQRAINLLLTMHCRERLSASRL